MDQNFQTTSRTQNDSNRRRFSDEQIKYMELMFEAESRPESQMKEQLANELGLEPRQVSIWFQNRRARLKSKQIEREYNELKATYNALASSFESLQKENHSLLTKVQKLSKNCNIKVKAAGKPTYWNKKKKTTIRWQTTAIKKTCFQIMKTARKMRKKLRSLI